MSEPPGPRNHSSQPEEPMQPGPRQPPPDGEYPPPRASANIGHRRASPNIGHHRASPQPRTEYDQRRSAPQPGIRPAPPAQPDISEPRPGPNTTSAARPSPDILKSRSPGPNTTSAARPNPDIRKDRSPRPNISSVPSPRAGYRPLQQGYQQQPPYAPRQQPYTVHRASEETTRDTQAALAARMELGPEYTEHIAEGLAERVEQLAAIRAGELRYEAEVANSTSRNDQSGRVRGSSSSASSRSRSAYRSQLLLPPTPIPACLAWRSPGWASSASMPSTPGPTDPESRSPPAESGDAPLGLRRSTAARR